MPLQKLPGSNLQFACISKWGSPAEKVNKTESLSSQEKGQIQNRFNCKATQTSKYLSCTKSFSHKTLYQPFLSILTQTYSASI